jgi:hypothetical protein
VKNIPNAITTTNTNNTSNNNTNNTTINTTTTTSSLPMVQQQASSLSKEMKKSTMLFNKLLSDFHTGVHYLTIYIYLILTFLLNKLLSDIDYTTYNFLLDEISNYIEKGHICNRAFISLIYSKLHAELDILVGIGKELWIKSARDSKQYMGIESEIHYGTIFLSIYLSNSKSYSNSLSLYMLGIYHEAIVGEGLDNKIPNRRSMSDTDSDRDRDRDSISEIRRKTPVKETSSKIRSSSSVFEDSIVFIRILTGVTRDRYLKDRATTSNHRSVSQSKSSTSRDISSSSSSSSIFNSISRDRDSGSIHDPSDSCLGNTVYSMSALLRICCSCQYYLTGNLQEIGVYLGAG